MNVKNTVVQAFDRLGYKLTPTWREPRLALANLTRTLLEMHSVNCVIDVGANEGQYHDFIRAEVGFVDRIISFEPQPALVKALMSARGQEPLWEVHGLALGERETELTLNLMRRSVFSSFLEPDNAETPQFETDNHVLGQCRVPVRRLDALLETDSASRYFLKCDTQGFDMDVVRGARKLLNSIVAVQVEIAVTPIYQGLPKYYDTLKELDLLGFQPAGFFPVSTNSDGSSIEFDCVLVNKHVNT